MQLLKQAFLFFCLLCNFSPGYGKSIKGPGQPIDRICDALHLSGAFVMLADLLPIALIMGCKTAPCTAASACTAAAGISAAHAGKAPHGRIVDAFCGVLDVHLPAGDSVYNGLYSVGTDLAKAVHIAVPDVQEACNQAQRCLSKIGHHISDTFNDRKHDVYANLKDFVRMVQNFHTKGGYQFCGGIKQVRQRIPNAFNDVVNDFKTYVEHLVHVVGEVVRKLGNGIRQDGQKGWQLLCNACHKRRNRIQQRRQQTFHHGRDLLRNDRRSLQDSIADAAENLDDTGHDIIHCSLKRVRKLFHQLGKVRIFVRNTCQQVFPCGFHAVDRAFDGGGRFCCRCAGDAKLGLDNVDRLDDLVKRHLCNRIRRYLDRIPKDAGIVDETGHFGLCAAIQNVHHGSLLRDRA